MYYIGIDLGGTNIAGGLVLESGEIVKRASLPTQRERSSASIIEDIVKVIKQLLPEEGLEAIGIGVPGIADKDGMVIGCVNLNWYDVPLKQLIQEQIDIKVPILIGNDATVAGVAEFEVARKGQHKDAIFLTLGTGVGGCIIQDGKALIGNHGIASEVGHMIIDREEGRYVCGCGRQGCLETLTSSTAIIEHARYLLSNDNSNSKLRELCYGDLAQVDGEKIFKAAASGDPLANKVVDRMTNYLAIGIMNMVSILDPEIFVLGGGLSNAGSFLTEKINRKLSDLLIYKAMPLPKVDIAILKNDAGILGAAMYSKLMR